MSNAFGRRFLAGIIDSTLIVIAHFFMSFYLMLYFRNYRDAEVFVVIPMLFFPPFSIIYSFQIMDMDFIVIFGILFLFETVYYTVMEASSLKGTIGKLCTRVCIANIEGGPVNLYMIILRSFLKAISRNLYMIPFLTVLITRKKQSLYDVITKTIVIRRA